MKKNDRFPLIIEDMSVTGEGIGHHDGMTFFVKDAVIGDEITAQVTKLRKHYGYARMMEITKPSPDRAAEVCPIAKKCGGCQIQALSYDRQLAWKQQRVRGDLIRIGGFEAGMIDAVMEPIAGIEEPFRYRNKAQFPVGTDRDGNIVIGYYAARSHRIIPVEDCLLGVPENQQVIRIVRVWMEEHGVEPYDEETGRGLIRHILIRKGFTSGEVMVCIVVNGTFLPEAEDLADALRTIPGMTSICLNENTRRTNVILGDRTHTLWGEDYITDSIGGVKFRISARSFFQVNPRQTARLYGQVLDYAGLKGDETVWDLYCGIGTISLFLAQRAGQVYGVEVIPEAIEDARRNAALNGMDNADFYAGRAEEVLLQFYEEASRAEERDTSGRDSGKLHPDVIVVDPPRKGCDEKCLETMAAMRPLKIVYVSCDPATLARDLKYLCAEGYELRRVRAYDQFPQSCHIETVCLLTHS